MFDQERSKERWLFSQARLKGKLVEYPDKILLGQGREPTINSTLIKSCQQCSKVQVFIVIEAKHGHFFVPLGGLGAPMA